MATPSTKDTVRDTVRTGLIAGLVAVSLSAIGMVQTFNARDIITGVLTLGQILLFSAPLAAGFIVMRNQPGRGPIAGLISSVMAGILAAFPVAALVLIAVSVDNIRSKLVNVSAALVETLTFGEETTTGLCSSSAQWLSLAWLAG
jgi:hypothetical protein